ncbi:MAG: 2-oxoacid:ferredoxin oxidoreductase subunit beta [Bdellovibrionota bacterium]
MDETRKTESKEDTAASATKLARKDFISQIEPKWCLGCGCYGAFKALTTTFANLGIPREKFAAISGIGCSSRFPYYLNTYGFHTIHGRAPTVALGLKLVQPDLSVWVITGDGDALSIGGNHFLHLMRRNPDIKVILFNNQIYGLTKGQTSPTSAFGAKTKSAPYGSVDTPVHPLSIAIAAGATFAARITDTDGEFMVDVFTEAAKHKGVAFIEIFLNCVIFNDGAFTPVTDKTQKAGNSFRLKHGEPMIFGAEKEKGIRLNRQTMQPEIVDIRKDGTSDLLVHDASAADSSLAYMLSLLEYPKHPVPMGIFRKVSRPSYESYFMNQHGGDLNEVLCGNAAWREDKDGMIHPVSSRNRDDSSE